MPSLEQALAEIARRQEAGIAIQSALVERVEALTELVRQMLEWANKPPSSDLTDAINAMTDAMETLSKQMVELPERVAAEVRRQPR